MPIVLPDGFFVSLEKSSINNVRLKDYAVCTYSVSKPLMDNSGLHARFLRAEIDHVPSDAFRSVSRSPTRPWFNRQIVGSFYIAPVILFFFFLNRLL